METAGGYSLPLSFFRFVLASTEALVFDWRPQEDSNPGDSPVRSPFATDGLGSAPALVYGLLLRRSLKALR
jgi:hypothetical protein